MKILFAHPNMPGQYKHLAPHFAKDPKNEVVFLTEPKKFDIPNVTKIEYKVEREVKPQTHRYLIPFERAVFTSQEVWRVCKKLKESGFTPDIIVGHLGWGQGMFLKDIYPDTPILSLFEFYYNSRGGDVNFMPEENLDADSEARIRMKNALHLFNLTYSDWGICPTQFQLDQHPKDFHHKISMIHDGVDVNTVVPGSGRTLTLPNGTKLTPKDEIVTYISRNFEPYRGFPTFMRAAEKILKERPNCHILMVGQDDVSYGKKPEGNKTWRQVMMEEVTLPKDRFHFLGYLPHDQMIKVLQISGAHIYLTVPFVLSWSMVEALSTGALVIGSNTEPVLEVIEHEKNGLIVDFFSPDDIVAKVNQVFEHPDRMRELRHAARKTAVDKYALDTLLPLHISLVEDLAAGKLPPPTAKKIEKIYA